ncbi:MAG: hypothetical protein OXJ90_02685 [Spirochaetaceae bacterium]|nr:hypothetical protein [Spirochaetaceae bacterium]
MIDRFTVGGAELAIARELGCNLFSWVVDGREVFHRPAAFPERGLPYAGGNPLLFPAVGRTWDRSAEPPAADAYRLAGHEAPLLMPTHGFLDRCRIGPPQVDRSAEYVTLIYTVAVPEEVARASYPWAVAVRLELSLTPHRVEIELCVRNLGGEPAPYAFGAHPYLAISDPGRDGVSLALPASRAVELDPELLVPSGATRALAEPFCLDPEASYDNVFTDLSGAEAVLTDRGAGRRIAVGYDGSITQFVIYAPQAAPFVCVEPWTAGLDGFSRLADPSWRDAPPLPLLPAAAEARITVSISVGES